MRKTVVCDSLGEVRSVRDRNRSGSVEAVREYGTGAFETRLGKRQHETLHSKQQRAFRVRLGDREMPDRTAEIDVHKRVLMVVVHPGAFLLTNVN